MRANLDPRVGGARSGRRGGALVMIALVLSMLAMLSLTMLSMSLSTSHEQRGAREDLHARYVCEAGLSEAVFDLRNSGTGNIATQAQPMSYGSSAAYSVEATPLGGELIQLVASGSENRQRARMELVVRLTNAPLFRWAAFGDTELDVLSNARVDSYNSTLGTYASQAINGSGNSQHALQGGNVGSNGNVLTDSNVKVWGDASSGPGYATTVTGNSLVSGATASLPQPQLLDPINLPAIAQGSDLTVSGATPYVLASGDHHFGTMQVKTGAEIHVTGPARIIAHSFRLFSNAKFIVDATNGDVEIWVIDDFILNSNTLMASTTKRPRDLAINLLSDNIIDPAVVVDLDLVTLDSNAQLYGTIYAPDAAIEIDSNFQLFGALMASRVALDSNSRVHFDEDLLNGDNGGDPIVVPVSWRLLSRDPD